MPHGEQNNARREGGNILWLCVYKLPRIILTMVNCRGIDDEAIGSTRRDVGEMEKNEDDDVDQWDLCIAE